MVSPVVHISDGKLRGKEYEIVNSDKVFAFLGVPYARPPVGDLRFKAPLPVEPWEGIRDATKDGNPCFGPALVDKTTVRGSEDCLNLNVFTKSLESDKRSPVMVFIHAGGFTAGSNTSKLCNPYFLLTEDVVLVAINYRLGMLGFLSLNDPSLEVPGNAGLKDQRLALEWVQKNIEHFGGDPGNVTIFGLSAGSACVHYHILSPASKGLFHKAILQSGSVHNPWSYGTAKLLEVLRISGIQKDDEASALEYVRNLQVEELYALQSAYIKAVQASLRTFGPVVEKPNKTSFLVQEPVEILASGNYNKVPMIMGYCEREGQLFFIDQFMAMNSLWDHQKSAIEKDVAIFLGLDMSSSLFKAVMKELEAFYITRGMEDGKVLLISDLLFTAGVITSAKLHAATSTTPVYLYRFSFCGELNIFKFLMSEEESVATHGDDMGYIFDARLAPSDKRYKLEKESPEEKTVKRMVKMWTNFAKTSNPTPLDSDLGIVWEPLKQNNFPYLDIRADLVLRIDPEKDRMTVWEEIARLYKSHGVKISQ